MKNIGNSIKLGIGLIIGSAFLVWTLWNVDYGQMAAAFAGVNYWYLLPMVIIIFFSHWLRALRWQFLLLPVKLTTMKNLFSSLMIGYMANIFLPAHLGEFVRAYLIGKNESMPSGLTFSTIVIERIVDMFSLLFLMALAIILYPFPDWVSDGGYIMLAGTFGILFFLVALKLNPQRTFKLIDFCLTPFPQNFKNKIQKIIQSFLAGLNPLKHWSHYIWMSILSVVIWLCYGIVFYIGFFAFNFSEYNLSVLAALVLLVITTIGVVIPSSPGYVGTYHKLCQIGLGFFGVPESLSAAFAVVLHGLNFFPILLVGLYFASKEGLSFKSLTSRERIQES